MAKAKRITSRGALVVADLALVDRLWSGVPSREAIAMVTRAPPSAPRADAPGAAEPFDAKGLDVALSALTRRKTLDLPLAQALHAKRSLGIPWRWLTAIPGAKEEARADERLIRWAEVTRLPEFSSSDVIVVASAVEGSMVGAAEHQEAFVRFGSAAFGEAVQSLEPGAVEERLLEAWDDAAPLMVLAGVDDEEALWKLASERVAEVRALWQFAKAHSLAVIPWSAEANGDFLTARARARTIRP